MRLSWSALILTVLVGSSCGTRVHDPIAAGAPVAGGTVAQAAVGALTDASSPLPVAPGLPSSAAQTPRQVASGAPAAAAPTATTNQIAAPAATANTPPGARPGATAPRAAAPPLPAPATPGPAAAGPPAGKNLIPLVVASVGTQTGVVGSVVRPILDAAMVWVKYINGRGGLNGHAVKVISYDDGGDPARHRAQMQDAVERQKVQAFFVNLEVLTGRSSTEYVNQVGIPIIGNDMGGDWAYDSPMHFQQGTGGRRIVFTGVAAAADYHLPKGKTKFAFMQCVELEACDDKYTAASAKVAGFNLVYQAKSSIAAPDYTAECLGARNAGAEVFFLSMDANSMSRVGTACARQGYRPAFASVSSVVAARLSDDPNLTGMVASVGTFPWFQSGTPATDEFHAALRTYGASLTPGVPMGGGWTAGKLLERAGQNLPEPPTAAALLQNLWSMKDDTLGGLTQPLTYTRGRPQAPRSCWFLMAVQDKQWISPNGFQMKCARGPGD